MSYPRLIAIIAAVVLGTQGTAGAQQCCMPDISGSPSAGRLIEGIHLATLFLGAVPFFLLAGIGLWIRRHWRDLATPDPATAAMKSASSESAAKRESQFFGPRQPIHAGQMQD